jgi:hypothetical protein
MPDTIIPFDRVHDSGVREEFVTGSVRDTQKGKGRFDLIPYYSLWRLALHFEHGAVKYGDSNWTKGQHLRRYLCSAVRHTFKHLWGYRDEDHLAAAAWNIFAAIWTEEEIRQGRLPKELDDLQPVIEDGVK